MVLLSGLPPRGLRNNNPLNIRISGIAWRGKRPLSENTDGSFEQFDTLTNGIRAALINIRTYIRKYKINTPQTIIQRWAPASDGNDTEAYVAKVCKLTGYAPGEVISGYNQYQLCRLAWAMACVECGTQLSFIDFNRAYTTI